MREKIIVTRARALSGLASKIGCQPDATVVLTEAGWFVPFGSEARRWSPSEPIERNLDIASRAAKWAAA